MSFFGVTYANFRRTNLSVEIDAKITAKNVFRRDFEQLYRIEKIVWLNHANAKILALA
jgi:hypothetical protein